jgi:hypothetical protein
MPNQSDRNPPMSEAEKRRAQQEAGLGRTAERSGSGSGLVFRTQPGDPSAAIGTAGGVGSVGTRGIDTGAATSGMSGAPTNDAEPGGGMVGDREQRDVPKKGEQGQTT